jgi:tetrahydromethanopterin S-methyltransferase subunit G
MEFCRLRSRIEELEKKIEMMNQSTNLVNKELSNENI